MTAGNNREMANDLVAGFAQTTTRRFSLNLLSSSAGQTDSDVTGPLPRAGQSLRLVPITLWSAPEF